ncbi:hypothetical protein DL768_004170 [Monosporascus sp. mg162]|nr:hypothetical protein DL768_004170 [Monosporascus sp. mg162]
MLPEIQTAVVQSQGDQVPSSAGLAVTVAHDVPVPRLPADSPHHVLVRVLAVALNPTDFKMVTYFPMPGNAVGCDFCGVVETGVFSHPRGTRVCGGMFPYNLDPCSDRSNGAFSQWVVADVRLLLKVPETWTDLQGAALGGVGWGTVGLALFRPDALGLYGRPSKPTEKNEPVLVYGGATATGTMACQVLKLSGYFPIAVTSPTSASLANRYGAVCTAHYTSPSCAAEARALAPGPIRYALDCITSAESATTCFGVIARVGGRYACLEKLPEAWRTRRAVKTKEVMGYEGLGIRVDFGPDSPYSCDANRDAFDICARWAMDMQGLLDNGLIETHPIRELEGRWDGILQGLQMLQKGEVRGEKLVVRLQT